MAEVEHIINSRPLTYVPVDTETEEALTPNHFLFGSSNGIKHFCEIDDSAGALRKNWIACENFGNHFWKRWVKEYLPSLTMRSKWFVETKPLAVGDIVIIVDENSPRNTWPKGKVVKPLPSLDGQVRSAVIKTKDGVYTRPATKLAVLEVGQLGIGNPNETSVLPGGSVAAPGNAPRSIRT
ncbi:uncharacterized protein LOC129954230 [Eupeodes corollae]|uniref:uncharacterized protein LOC129954230 n=1 Tax=Eupeodes corollae TaxID=290404 RepID=UPI002491240D|nr:uncharacterized protein LOC129954230 [Eupeodes corollae]